MSMGEEQKESSHVTLLYTGKELMYLLIVGNSLSVSEPVVLRVNAICRDDFAFRHQGINVCPSVRVQRPTTSLADA